LPNLKVILNQTQPLKCVHSDTFLNELTPPNIDLESLPILR